VWIVLAAALALAGGILSTDLSVPARSAKAEARDAKAEADKQTRVVPLPAGKSLAIEITIGSVRIEGWDKSDVEITIDRHAPSDSQLAKLPVVIDDTATRVAVRAIQGEGATDPAFRTDVAVRLPHTATIDRLQVMEGRISIAHFAGVLNADIRRGPIDGQELSGTLRLESGIGSVVLTGARLSAGGLLRLRAFNGDVRLTLAERPTDARIMALALNGSITSEIPLTLKETWGPRWGEATIGKGEPVISLDVVTGTVELRVR
jgi:DUF4097 and DUF4098 domain-containing protein YvlB